MNAHEATGRRRARVAMMVAVVAVLVTSAAPSVVQGDANEGSSNTRAVQTVITGGGEHTCALVGDGTARCWGDNLSGQLGNGTTVDSSVPVPVAGLTGAIAIIGGNDHSCALIGDGTVRCWGRNQYGQLGNGTTVNSSVPVVVAGLTGATAITGGYFQHTCALIGDGTARCWGWNGAGQLGNGVTNSGATTTPVSVTGLIDAVSIAAGDVFTCGLLGDGTVRCWGDNFYGQLGIGTTTDSSSPVTVVGLTGATAITVGGAHACALLAGGSARCWGYNGNGQLGNGTVLQVSTPVAVTGLTTAAAVTAGYLHTCALLADGSLRCWGRNANGQLGNGTTTQATTPVTVTGLTVTVTTCVSVDTTGIVGWWRGDGNLDAQIGPDASGPATYGTGRAGQGFSITPNASLSAAGVAAPTSALTLELWAKPTASAGTVQTLLSRWSGVGFTSAVDDGHAYNLELHPNNDLVFETDDLSTRVPEQLRISAPQLFDGNVHHIAATWTTTTMTLYVDGVQAGTRASQGGLLQTGGLTPVRLGGPFGYTGVIDEPTIWNRALTSTEIAAIAASTAAKCA